PSIRPWQVDPAQDATPRKRPPPSPCERAGEAPRSSASRSMTSTAAKTAGAAHDVSPRPCPACVPISATPFARPAFCRLNHSEGKHRVGNLLESRDIGALHIIDIAARPFAIGQAARVDARHDVLQHLLQFALAPAS